MQSYETEQTLNPGDSRAKNNFKAFTEDEEKALKNRNSFPTVNENPYLEGMINDDKLRKIQTEM